jgi:hypothetical protein
MPKSLERKRGGVIRYRTKTIYKHGRPIGYVHVAIVRKKGKRGGRTIVGRFHRYKHR